MSPDDSFLTDEEQDAARRLLAGDKSAEETVTNAIRRYISENADRFEEEYQERQLLMVFRDCPECGHSIGCKLQEDGTVNAPKDCNGHT